MLSFVRKAACRDHVNELRLRAGRWKQATEKRVGCNGVNSSKQHVTYDIMRSMVLQIARVDM